MFASSPPNLLSLPHFIIEDILLKVIEMSAQDLKNVLLSCSQFNQLIKRKVIQNPTKKWCWAIKRIEEKLAGEWSLGVYPTSNELKDYLILNDEKILRDYLFMELSDKIKSTLSISGTRGVGGMIADFATCEDQEFVQLIDAAATLVEMRSLKFSEVWIYSIDLTAVDVEFLKTILSNTERLVKFSNTRGQPLNHIFPSVGSQVLGLRSLELTQLETKALVETMEMNISSLILGSELGEQLTLDISELTKYSGLEDSKCELITLWADCRDCYGEEMRNWAEEKGWTIVYDSRDDGLELQKM